MTARSCGFKSHLPHTESMNSVFNNFIRFAEVSELADEQDSGSCERYAREGSSPFFRMKIPGSVASGFLCISRYPDGCRNIFGRKVTGYAWNRGMICKNDKFGQEAEYGEICDGAGCGNHQQSMYSF